MTFQPNIAMTKLLYLALRNIKKKWTMPIRDWGKVLNQFAILFESRVPLTMILSGRSHLYQTPHPN